MKYILTLLIFFYAFLPESHAQLPNYYFSVNTDSAYESNSIILAGYVKTNNAPTISDSVVILMRSGVPRPTHIDTTSKYIINFAPGQDSTPFIIRIMNDTFPEYPEHVLYTLADPVNGSTIGSDSSLLFVLIDTTPPAMINYIVDSISCFEATDSFYNGVYVQYQSTYNVGINVHNPNPFYIRYIAENIGCYNGVYPYINACGLSDFFFNLDTLYAPPGNSTIYKTAYLVDNNSTTDKYFYCVIRNIDANESIDSLVFFTIKHVNYFDTASLSFDRNSIIEVNDSFQSIGIPISITNPNERPMYFRLDTIQTSTVYPGINFTFNNQEYGYGNGISHDTLWINFINRHLTGDTISMVLALRNDSVNASSDTLLYITVVDTGGNLVVSFLGAGLAHLKSDSIGYVQVYNNFSTKYPISVKVSYLNGNAIRDTDFIFDDTTLVFPAYSYDTISVPVIMLQDHLYQGNTQVNLQLSDVSPSTVQYGITQYTFTIIDDEDSGLTPLSDGQSLKDQNIKIHPNPFDNEISIETDLPLYNISITNSLGEQIYDRTDQKTPMTIRLSDQPSGLYLVRISNGDKTYVTKVVKL